MENTISRLELEYCPPLDSALLQAILSDFDLGNEDALGQARQVLDSIKASAAEEEAATAFDAAGTSDASPVSQSAGATSEAAETEVTSLSNGFSKLLSDDEELSGASSPVDGPDLNSLDLQTKTMLLQELFPAINDYTVTHTLTKCNGDWQRALDELLNISSFASETGSDGEKVASKGIDAFAEGATSKRGRRKKPKGLNSKLVFDDRRARSASALSPIGPESSNKWQTASLDIDFIARHAQLSSTLVKSAYYANGASVSKTISHLLDELIASRAKVTSMDHSVNNHAVELGRDFPSVKPAYLTALIQLTHPSTASAHELAKVLVARPSSSNMGPIVPQYAPVNLSDEADEGIGHQMGRQIPALDHDSASSLALGHREAHRRLAAQAQAAYRRSRSQHLMGGAAAYYSSVAREHATSAVAHGSAAADALVRSQSTASQLDLHGVTVSDAVRIASRETRVWWDSLGEARFNGRVGVDARQAGFRIVVGLGRHSEGGRSKIGPAVYSALANAGWRVDKGEGVLTVKGKTKK